MPHSSSCSGRRRRGILRLAVPAVASRWRLAALGGAWAALAAASAGAQLADAGSAAGLKLTATLEKVVESTGADGTERFELGPGVAPAAGEQFILTIRFVNVAGVTTDGVRITSAIPDGMSYVQGSATGPGGLVLFSTDGSRTFATAQELAATAAATVPRSAAPLRYTHVRWVLEAPLEAGTTGFVRLRLTAR
jgi:uncharacterized repeat protein (TIGR01451 family)